MNLILNICSDAPKKKPVRKPLTIKNVKSRTAVVDEDMHDNSDPKNSSDNNQQSNLISKKHVTTISKNKSLKDMDKDKSDSKKSLDNNQQSNLISKEHDTTISRNKTLKDMDKDDSDTKRSSDKNQKSNLISKKHITTISRNKTLKDMDKDVDIKDIDMLLNNEGATFEPVFSDKLMDTFGKLNPYLIKLLKEKMNITKATAIQEIAIPALINGRDVLIKSATGSGKTLSFAIPLVNDLECITPPINRDSGIYALVICPTRELSQQTHEVLEKITRHCVRIVTGQLIAGTKGKIEKRALRRGVNIIVATPNRLLYHLDHSKHVVFDKLRWLIIDEADRMTEMGFGDSMRRVIQQINQQRQGGLDNVQTVLVSATLTSDVEKIAELALKDPLHAVLDGPEEEKEASLNPFSSTFALPESLQHYLIVCPTKLRMVCLLSFLLLKCRYAKHAGKVVVFMATQDLVEYHYMLFNQLFQDPTNIQQVPNASETNLSKYATDINIFRLHGSMEARKRQNVFRKFDQCKHGFLLTTDLCSRGLDIANVAWVVQYHPPKESVYYVHRAGRTARAGQQGKSLLFLQPAEVNYVAHLQSQLGGLKFKKLPLSLIMQKALIHSEKVINKHSNKKPEYNAKSKKSAYTVEESIFLTCKVMEGMTDDEPVLKQMGKLAFQSLVRSYASMNKDIRKFLCYKDLHLGHVAKSLAMIEKPSEMGAERQDRNMMTVDKRKRTNEVFKSGKKRKTTELNPVNAVPIKKKKATSTAYANMLAEYGL